MRRALFKQLDAASINMWALLQTRWRHDHGQKQLREQIWGQKVKDGVG